MNKILPFILVILLFIIMILVIFMTIWSMDEERCYNIPLNRVYEDPLCQLHTETYEELNRRK